LTVKRPTGVYTIGYEDLRIDQFLNKLVEHRIDTVVDVRRLRAGVPGSQRDL